MNYLKNIKILLYHVIIKMKLLYYLVAIGESRLEDKISILIHNLEYIYNNIEQSFDIIVNCYGDDTSVLDNLNKITYIDNIYSHTKEQGILTELFLTNPHNNKVHNYDYIIFILDDVKITNCDLNDIIRVKNKYNIEFISPKIINSSQNWMKNYDDIIITNFLEMYLHILTPHDFDKLCSLHSIENRTMWGVDLLYGYFNIKVGVINKYEAIHMLPPSSNASEANERMHVFLRKHGFEGMAGVFNKYSPIIEVIKE